MKRGYWINTSAEKRLGYPTHGWNISHWGWPCRQCTFGSCGRNLQSCWCLCAVWKKESPVKQGPVRGARDELRQIKAKEVHEKFLPMCNLTARATEQSWPSECLDLSWQPMPQVHLLTEWRNTPSQSKKSPSDLDLMELQQDLQITAEFQVLKKLLLMPHQTSSSFSKTSMQTASGAGTFSRKKKKSEKKQIKGKGMSTFTGRKQPLQQFNSSFSSLVVYSTFSPTKDKQRHCHHRASLWKKVCRELLVWQQISPGILFWFLLCT